MSGSAAVFPSAAWLLLSCYVIERCVCTVLNYTGSPGMLLVLVVCVVC